MPKYEAISLLCSRTGGQYIQPGEVFELDDQEAETLLLNAGHIKAAQMDGPVDLPEDGSLLVPDEKPIKKHKPKDRGSE